MNKVILGFILIALTFSQKNYQQRSIFYSRANNLCCGGMHADLVNVIINIDDTDRIRRTMRGNGNCATWYIFCADAIDAYDMAYILEQSSGNKTYVDFNQEVIKKNTLGLLTHITLKLTVKNPVTIFSKEYNCTILGDGTEHHWGIDYEEFPPAEVYMRCLSIKQPLDQIGRKISSQ